MRAAVASASRWCSLCQGLKCTGEFEVCRGFSSAGALLLNGYFILKAAQLLFPFNSAQDQMARAAAVGMTLFYYPLVYWSLRGMEVGMVTMLMSLAVRVVETAGKVRPAAARSTKARLARMPVW